MAATPPKPRHRARTKDPAGRLTLRLGKEQVAFLTAEAGKVGLATTEYVRNPIVRSIQARELQEALADVRAMLAELRATARGGTEGPALEALFEVRAMLATAAVRDPLIVTNAREEARKELAVLKTNK
ncbi:MAG TPA: hypothetical protein VG425_16005 [Casimicrobiaceae bacterium]|nr:hypothetical protein [Casimicrobiaceae bacterium]